MGSELVGDSLPHGGGGSMDSTALSYTEVFYNHLPYYLAIGMPNDLFWNGDCRLTESYRKAYEIKRKQLNQELWLQGMYFYEALCDASPLLQPFAKKPKPLPYPSEPYAITIKKEEIEEKQRRQEQLKYEKAKAKMASWAVKTNAQLAVRAGKEVNDGQHH